MNVKLKRLLSLLLAFILVIGLPVSAMAATDDSGIDETEPTTSIETSPIGESAEPAAADAISAEAQAAEEPEIEIVQIKKGSKYWRLNGRDWENGINISYRLADGRSRSTNIKAINYHYLADLSNPGYCLEPNLVAPYYNEVGDSNSEAIFGIGDVDSGTLGATSWNKLTAEQREAIALVALYGLPNNIPFNGDDSSYCRAYFAAGQVLVWEFVMGIRYSAWPYEYVDPDITWSTARPRIPGSRLADFFADGPFIDAYYELAEMLETHFTIPSFAGDSLDNAETVELQPDGTGWYTATVADSNGILEKFVFQDSTGEVSFSNDGDNLVIRTKTVPNDPVFSATKQVPDPDGNSYFLTYAPGKSDRQKMLTIRTGDETEAVTAYIRLSVPVGAISGTKQTDTGADIQGWEMCLMDGDTIVATTTTDSEGKFAFTDVVPGTYTIHEVIPDDSDYRCVENDKMIAVAAGEVTTVMIENELNVGGLEIIKATDIGDHLAGWEFELYDASKNLIGTYTTPEDGRITISDLPVGVYYVKEKDSGNPYWVCDTSEKEVRVVAGQTSIVTITNCMKSAEIIGCKVDPLGQPLAGAVFLLEWSADGASWLPVNSTDLSYVTEGACTSEGLLDGCLTSGDDGIVRFSGLHPERYYQLTEVSAPNGYQLLVGAAFEGTIPADENLTVALTIVNAPEYVLPMTGSKSFIVMAVSLCICIAGCVGALVYLRRKEQ